MSELGEIKTMLKEQAEKVEDIHFAIFGNTKAGVAGMAATQIEHGKTIAEYKKLKYLGLGMATVSGAGLYQFLKNALHL